MKRTLFTADWEFARDDDEFGPVEVPHDAMLGNRRAADAPAGSASGYYLGARYRYRKTFELDAVAAEGVVMLEFEGVYRDARVRVNGCELEAPPYGFVPFFVDLAGTVRPGRNTIEVDARNDDQPDCRWYSGGGIYRPVWLWDGKAAHIEPEGVRVSTVSLDPATVHVSVAAMGGTPHVSIVDDGGAVIARASGAPGNPDGAYASISEHDGGDSDGIVAEPRFITEFDLVIPDAKLWSDDSPSLYRCIVELSGVSPEPSEPSGPSVVGGVMVGVVSERRPQPILDRAEVAFGIRMLDWSPAGLFVNGRETLLRGGCIHCDNGILGAASWPESEYRRISLLKQAGFNAVRIAHNPAPSALLDACDELGMYVMDEAWDMWFMRKNPHDYARHFLDRCDHDLRRLVAHDYNHPSVIMYSIGNEIADPITAEGVEIERSMVELVRSLDPSRPVTCGFNLTMMVMEKMGQGWYAQHEGDVETSLVATEDEPPRASMLFNLTAQTLGTGMTLAANLPGADALVSPALDALDIAGYNYAQARYLPDARKHPDRVVVGSETFPHKLPQNWALVKRLPNVIGDFMWAAWDYLGEAGAGAWAYTAEEAGFSKPWPWLIAGSGALDILGHPNAAAALAGAVWRTVPGPSIQVRPVNVMDRKTYKATWRGTDAIPSWSWRGCEGMQTEVEVYDGRAHSIRLELDGTPVGTARVNQCLARFKMPYRPGTLEAAALDQRGKELARTRLVSADGDLRLRLRVEDAWMPSVRNGERRLTYVSVEIVGENGQVESNADELVTVNVAGAGLLAFGSARPSTTESFLSGSYTTYRGRALAIVHHEDPDTATVTASGRTLPPVSITIAL